MSLANILREPRREITETVAGLVVFFGIGIPLVYADYSFAVWLDRAAGGGPNGCPWPLGMGLGVFLFILGLALLTLIHAIGERVCNGLESHGYRVRPVRRTVR
jgi:hypothetical protein